MQRGRPSMSFGAQAGPVTKALCGTLLVASILCNITERQLGFGTSDLVLSVADVLGGLQLWRVVTYPFIEASAFGLLLSVVVLFIFGGLFESQWGSRGYLRFFMMSAI